MTNELSRRAVVGGLSALAASGCAPEAPPSSPFPLGVAAGDATPDGALLWTKYPDAGALEVVVWPDGGEASSGLRVAAPSDDGFVLTAITGLAAGTWYRFRFESSAGATSPTGRFRTALADDALEPLTFGATSCIKRGYPLSALGHAAARTDVDAFVFLGDSVYTDGSSSLADFRRSWSEGLAGTQYQALRGSTSMIAQWDDHEVRNNWGGDDIDPKLEADARRAFTDHQPVRRSEDALNRLWRRLRWGRTAELFALDCRSERDSAKGLYVSDAQFDWLTQGVATSPAVFKLILNTVPIGSFDSAFFQPFNADNWQGFPAQRRRLLEALDASGTKNVLVLSGDFHFACVGRVASSGPGASLVEALVGPGAQSPNPLPSYPSAPQWDFSSAVNNYTTFALDPAQRTARIRYHAGDGRILFDKTYG